jgi:ATPase subunit of ABC transporter with duplicated ATPase domains
MSEIRTGSDLEYEKSPEERVALFANSLYKEMPQSREALKGEGLVEITDLAITGIKPTLRSEGKITIKPKTLKALTGSNGAGKTTFFKKVFAGEPNDETKFKSGLKVGYLPQHADFSQVENLTLEQVLDLLGEILAQANDWDFDYGLLETCKNIFFQGALQNKVGNLSGGEKTKLEMLTLLLRKVDLILLDEPTNHIDQQGQLLLTALIKKLKASGTAFLITSHNNEFLSQTAEDGALEISGLPDSRTVRDNPKYVFETKSPKPKYSIPWDLEKSAFNGQVSKFGTIKINGKEFWYDPIEEGKKIVLAGPNGSGKSSLLKHLVNGNLNKETVPAYLPQEWPENILNGSLENAVTEFQKINYRMNSENAKTNFYSNLVKSPLAKKRPTGTDWSKISFNSLSVGEQRLVWFLAIASSPGFNFLLLDEPTNHLDRELQADITKIITDFPGPALVVTHDTKLINTMESLDVNLSKKAFWLLDPNSGTNSINAWNGSDDYFNSLARKAEQSISQLGI